MLLLLNNFRVCVWGGGYNATGQDKCNELMLNHVFIHPQSANWNIQSMGLVSEFLIVIQINIRRYLILRLKTEKSAWCSAPPPNHPASLKIHTYIDTRESRFTHLPAHSCPRYMVHRSDIHNNNTTRELVVARPPAPQCTHYAHVIITIIRVTCFSSSPGVVRLNRGPRTGSWRPKIRTSPLNINNRAAAAAAAVVLRTYNIIAIRCRPEEATDCGHSYIILIHTHAQTGDGCAPELTIVAPIMAALCATCLWDGFPTKNKHSRPQRHSASANDFHLSRVVKHTRTGIPIVGYRCHYRGRRHYNNDLVFL